MAGGTTDEPDASTVALGSGGLASGRETLAALVGTRLGRYLVIEELGRGGMGFVLRAYDPTLQREVALKLVRTDRLGASAQARLVREARAMARIAHPNVVGVYDVETDEAADRVIVVMELVDGRTLEHWLAERSRTSAEIVAAFVEAGRGLAAAHAGDLLHRDFKPQNVLVGSDGRVRVTDFGLARPTERGSLDDVAGTVPPSSDGGSGSALSDALTAAGTVMGTPAYMAPEQFVAGELDARADQYAFCVALWRALTGQWPFQATDHGALVEAKRAGPPRWPTETKAPRHVVEALRRGLSPDPADRWPTLQALLAELERDGAGRGRRVLGAAVLVATGLGIFAWQRIDHAREIAACEREGARIARVYDDSRADAIADAFEATSIPYATDTWQRSRERLDRYVGEWSDARRRVCEAAEIERVLAPDLARAAAACLEEHRDSLDALLHELETPDAIAIARAASASASLPVLATCEDPARLRLRAEPPSDPALLEQIRAVRARLAEADAADAIGRYEAALVEAEAALADARALAWPPLVADAKLAVGHATMALARHEEARILFEEVFFEAASSGNDELAMSAATSLTFTVGRDLARHDDGLEWGRLAQTFAERLERHDDADEARVLSNLAAVHNARGDYVQSFQLAERALAIWEKVLGPDHPQVAMALNNAALDLHNRGEYERARPLEARALAIWEGALGPEHPHVAMALNNLGNTLHSQGDFPAAQAMHERALAIREGAYGPEHPAVAASLANLGNALHLQGRSEEARARFERALSIWEVALGPEHPDLVGVLSNIGVVLASQKAHARARELFERSIALGEKTIGPDHPEVARPLGRLGALHVELGAPELALEPLERSLAIFIKAFGTQHPDVAASQFDLARATWDLGRDRARALELAAAARETYRAAGEPAASDLAGVDRWLADHRPASEG
jgi:tetratricopeptide (TPR) repeat protein/predicted Ser/Thr protein kinase